MLKTIGLDLQTYFCFQNKCFVPNVYNSHNSFPLCHGAREIISTCTFLVNLIFFQKKIFPVLLRVSLNISPPAPPGWQSTELAVSGSFLSSLSLSPLLRSARICPSLRLRPAAPHIFTLPIPDSFWICLTLRLRPAAPHTFTLPIPDSFRRIATKFRLDAHTYLRCQLLTYWPPETNTQSVIG